MRTYCIAQETIYSVLCGDLNGKEIKKEGLYDASLAKTFLDSSAIFHEGAGIGNMSELTGALLASAPLLPVIPS